MSTTEENKALAIAVVDFLDTLGIDVALRHFSSDNIQIRCPFASVSGHSKTVDSNPSLGIKVSREGGFWWHCFSCGRKGRSLISFIRKMQDEGVLKDKVDPFHLQNALRMDFPAYEAIAEHERKEEGDAAPQPILPAHLVRASQSRSVAEYHRMVRKQAYFDGTLDAVDLRFDRMEQRVIFPCYDNEKKLVGAVRHYINGRKPKYFNDLDTASVLYLEWLKRGATAIVVEGMYDAVKIYQHLHALHLLEEYSVVGVFGTEVAPHQMHLLVRYFEKLIFMGDNDMAGIKMEKKLYNALHSKLPALFRIEYNGHDPDKVSLEGFRKALAGVRPAGTW